VKNADMIATLLLDDLAKVRLPNARRVVESFKETISLDGMISDQEEDKMLSDLEDRDGGIEADSPLLLEDAQASGRAKGSIEAADAQPSGALAQPVQPSAAQAWQQSFDENTKARIRNQVESLMKRFAEERFHVAFNLAALTINARDTRNDRKQAAVNGVLVSNQRFREFCFNILQIIQSEHEKEIGTFMMEWFSFAFMLSISDDMIGDPFLVNVFRRLLTKSKDTEHILMLLDLLLGCGEEDYERVLQKLKDIDRVEVTFALYVRVVSLYYFRYHREKDRKALRQLLKQMRMLHKGLPLPRVA
jgi:hypothetical protein